MNYLLLGNEMSDITFNTVRDGNFEKIEAMTIGGKLQHVTLTFTEAGIIACAKHVAVMALPIIRHRETDYYKWAKRKTA